MMSTAPGLSRAGTLGFFRTGSWNDLTMVVTAWLSAYLPGVSCATAHKTWGGHCHGHWRLRPHSTSLLFPFQEQAVVLVHLKKTDMPREYTWKHLCLFEKLRWKALTNIWTRSIPSLLVFHCLAFTISLPLPSWLEFAPQALLLTEFSPMYLVKPHSSLWEPKFRHIIMNRNWAISWIFTELRPFEPFLTKNQQSI